MQTMWMEYYFHAKDCTWKVNHCHRRALWHHSKDPSQKQPTRQQKTNTRPTQKIKPSHTILETLQKYVLFKGLLIFDGPDQFSDGIFNGICHFKLNFLWYCPFSHFLLMDQILFPIIITFSIVFPIGTIKNFLWKSLWP